MNVYKPKYFQSTDNWKIGELTLKPYLINLQNDDINRKNFNAILIEKSKQYAQQALVPLLSSEGHDGGGYAIIHKGQFGIWLLLHWWAHKDMLLTSLAFTESNDHSYACFDGRPEHSCVWEHVVINHERDAWVNTVMTANSNLDDYLNRKLKNGTY